MSTSVDASPIHAHGFLRIQSASSLDQSHRKRMVNAPVARVQGIGQRRACRNVAHAHVKKFGLIGRQTRFDVAQRLAVGQLRKGHGQELVHAGEILNLVIASVLGNAAAKRAQRQEGHELRENKLALVHEGPLRADAKDHK